MIQNCTSAALANVATSIYVDVLLGLSLTWHVRATAFSGLFSPLPTSPPFLSLCCVSIMASISRGQPLAWQTKVVHQNLGALSNGTGHLDGCATGLDWLGNGIGPVMQPVSATGGIRTSG